MTWSGDNAFVISSLVQKDFKIRYRNMSLGVFWSLLNPLILMGVLTFVFTKIFAASSGPYYSLSILCGLVPFNFFSLAWSSGTFSIIENTSLIKRVPVPRIIIPISSVLANCLHLLIQVSLLLLLTVTIGPGINLKWLWLPVVWGLEVVFLIGLAMTFSAINVFVRDTRYVVESANTVLFWLVPIFYPFTLIPARFREIYLYNPVAALVMALRNILLEARSPAPTLLWKLTFVAFLTLAVGTVVFGWLQRRFYEYL